MCVQIPEVDALTNDKDKDLAAEARAEKQRLLTTVSRVAEVLDDHHTEHGVHETTVRRPCHQPLGSAQSTDA